MEAHLAVLLDAVKRFDARELQSDDEILVWWGKVRLPNRRGLSRRELGEYGAG